MIFCISVRSFSLMFVCRASVKLSLNLLLEALFTICVIKQIRFFFLLLKLCICVLCILSYNMQ